MRYDASHSVAAVSNTKFRVFVSPVLFILLLVVVLLCPGCDRDVSPPDVSKCTLLEIRFPWSAANYFLRDSGLQESLLSEEEKEYIQSIQFFSINDPERIKAFARDVSSGTYSGSMRFKRIDAGVPVVIDCYCDKERMVSFTVLSDCIITEDQRLFNYPRGLPKLEIIEPVEMQPFKLRYQCGSNMGRIYTSGPLYYKDVRLYPEPRKWCDAVMQERTNTSYVTEDKMRSSFKCPAAGEGTCHYTLNPNCEPNSPPDTVLLLESDAGWNSYGGPELFTFEHHEPRGGCVMLNNGTVKFIRTKEEIEQLRWK